MGKALDILTWKRSQIREYMLPSHRKEEIARWILFNQNWSFLTWRGRLERMFSHHRLIDAKHDIRITYKDKFGKTRQKHQRVNTVEEAIRTVDDLKRQYCELGPSAWDGARMQWEQMIQEYQKAHP